MLLSVGLFAVVGIIPLFSSMMARFRDEDDDSLSSGGFKRRTSSRSNCRSWDPRWPSQLVDWVG